MKHLSDILLSVFVLLVLSTVFIANNYMVNGIVREELVELRK
jgi:hypothetical protein